MAYQSLPHHSRRKNKILVNTLVILGIVIILCIIGGPHRNAYRVKSWDSAAASDLRNLAHYQDVYRKNNGSYADSFEKLGYQLTDKVTAYILAADKKHCSMFTFHYKGTKIYLIDRPEGEIRVYELRQRGPSFWHR